jgi:multiple sugar transport system ATP-binding protein
MGKISIKNIVKEYSKGELSVKGINLEIKDKEFVVLVGPSGCGKSTTLRMLAGLEDITSGEIYFDDTLVNELPPRLRDISMVFQSYALYPHLSIKENLEFGLKIAKMDEKEIGKRVKEVSDMLEITEYLDRKPAALSGGQRQRVAMGRAIARYPNIFLFDEPLSNLDAKLRNKMRFEIKQLHKKLQRTIVYVTHDQIEAMTLADRIVVMKDGEIQQEGTPLDVFNYPVNKFVATFLGSPPMNLANGIIKGSDIKLEDGKFIKIPCRYKSNVIEGQEVILGVRADSIVPNQHKNILNYNSFEEVVIAEEPLGVETNLFITVGNTQFISRMNHPKPIPIGSKLEFFINLDKTYLFDKETELTIKES